MCNVKRREILEKLTGDSLGEHDFRQERFICHKVDDDNSLVAFNEQANGGTGVSQQNESISGM